MQLRSHFGHPLSGVTQLLTVAALKALDVGENLPGERFTLTDGRVMYYHATSALTGDDIFVIAPTTGSGRYLLAPGQQCIEIAIAFGTADAAILATCPTGFEARVARGYWRITTAFTGGSSSAIGVSSSNATGHTTKGDLHGGAGGDVEASLTAGTRLGTIGADVAAGAFLIAANTIRFDRITSAFTAGAGFVGLILDVIANPGA